MEKGQLYKRINQNHSSTSCIYILILNNAGLMVVEVIDDSLKEEWRVSPDGLRI